MNIYVGNLSFKTSEGQLQELFEDQGKVSAVKIIMDQFSGQSKGFGFVEMDNDSEANAALENLNGTELDGKQLTVNEARPKIEGGGNYRSNGGGGGYKGNSSGGGYGGGN